MKKIMGLIIGTSLGFVALAQNTNMNNNMYNNAPSTTAPSTVNPSNMSPSTTNPYNYNNTGTAPGTINTTPGVNTPGSNTVPGSVTPSTGTINNTYDQSSNTSTYGTPSQNQQVPSNVSRGAVGTGDSLLNYPNSNSNMNQVPGVTPNTTPGVTPNTTPNTTTPNRPATGTSGRESGYNFNSDSNSMQLAQAIVPDPKSKKQKRNAAEMSPENVARKQEDKTAHALPNNYRIPDALKPSESPTSNLAVGPNAQGKVSGCSLNDELAKKQGTFKAKRMVGDGELVMERAKDGDEKIKYTDNQEYYRYERRGEDNKEKFSYGVTKDYETMELRKKEDGTAEIIYQGIFPSLEAAKDAIANGIIVEEMGNVCKLDVSEK